MFQKFVKALLLPIALLLAMPVSAAFSVEKGNDTGPVIIDVRTEAEWTAGHLEGAILIPHERIGEGISRVTSDKKEKIYLYCRTGRRTGIAVDILQKAGYENLTNLETVENASKILGRRIVK